MSDEELKLRVERLEAAVRYLSAQADEAFPFFAPDPRKKVEEILAGVPVESSSFGEPK